MLQLFFIGLVSFILVQLYEHNPRFTKYVDGLIAKTKQKIKDFRK